MLAALGAMWLFDSSPCWSRPILFVCICLKEGRCIGHIYIFFFTSLNLLYRASDILRKQKQNFAGFSGANSRKNRPISRDFCAKKGQNSPKNRPISGIFAGKKSKFAEKSADFAGFQWKKVTFRRKGQSDFTGNFGGKLRQETISKKQPISLDFWGEISLKSINFASI